MNDCRGFSPNSLDHLSRITEDGGFPELLAAFVDSGTALEFSREILIPISPSKTVQYLLHPECDPSRFAIYIRSDFFTHWNANYEDKMQIDFEDVQLNNSITYGSDLELLINKETVAELLKILKACELLRALRPYGRVTSRPHSSIAERVSIFLHSTDDSKFEEQVGQITNVIGSSVTRKEIIRILCTVLKLIIANDPAASIDIKPAGSFNYCSASAHDQNSYAHQETNHLGLCLEEKDINLILTCGSYPIHEAQQVSSFRSSTLVYECMATRPFAGGAFKFSVFAKQAYADQWLALHPGMAIMTSAQEEQKQVMQEDKTEVKAVQSITLPSTPKPKEDIKEDDIKVSSKDKSFNSGWIFIAAGTLIIMAVLVILYYYFVIRAEKPQKQQTNEENKSSVDN